MKRTALFLAIVLVLSVFSLASCGVIPGLDKFCPHMDIGDDNVCDVCGKDLGETESCQHADVNNNHKCDKCEEPLSECADANNDHKCDVCAQPVSECADANNDHKCDVCGKPLSECADADNDHKCDVCGKPLSECADANNDHNCDLCGKPVSECADADKDHNCDLCGKSLSECADEDEDHICDYCENCIHEYEENIFWHPELVAATCTTPGVAVFECMYCDDYYTEVTEIDPEAHAFWGDEEIVTEASCVTKTNGLKKVKCANEGCDAVEEVEIYYSEMHDWDVQKEVYATCTEDGEYYAVCTICGEVDSYVMYAEGHYNWYLTCGDTGLCMACETEFTVEHNTTFSPATCTTAAHCMNCMEYVGEPLGHLDEDSDYYCDRCEEDIIPENLERVDYNLNISDLEAGTLSADLINGKFTITSGSEIRNRSKTFEGVEYLRSVKIGNKTTMIKVSVPGSGKLTFLVQNGSSGAATQFITVTAPDGTVYDMEFVGTDAGSPVVMIEIAVTEGEWIISRGKNGGTQDIFALSLNAIVEKSDENGFEIVSEGTVDYLAGQTIDLSGLVLNATYSNGKTEPLSLADVTVDTSLVDFTKAGSYTVTVNYKEYDAITYTVNVYLPESITFGFDATVQQGQSSAGNGLYINQSLKEVYGVGETLDLTGLTVIVNGVLGDKTLSLDVDDSYTVSEVDLSTAGKKTLTITYSFCESKIEATFDIYVVDAEPSIVEDTYMVKVDKAYTGAIGAVVDGYNVFTTLQQALDFLAKADASKMKRIEILEGYYEEKLEITIPNLHIVGAGKDKVTIEWDSIYGIKDAGGFSQVTDSTQTVAIRDTAFNVTIEGVTISNYWNSQERMDAAGLEIERGLALLVQADRFIMKDSALLGIQDTLELFTGRQYFENVFISGYTDFIFGTNNTTLFNNCTIHVIDTSKDDKGTAGYLTAFKGSNKGSADAITYGAIFYKCDFTADEGVSAGKTAIGRTWGAYAAVAVIESKLGGHISIDGYDSANNKNKRYISMNGIHPTDSTVQFVEYGNTGAGAISEAVAGMKMLTAEEAAKYTNIEVIFGKTNGGVSYLDAWNPASTEIVEDDRTYYYFNGQTGSTGTSYTYDQNIQGATGTFGGITIDATTGKVTARDSDTQINAGAKLIFNVEAGTLVTVISYPGYGYYTLNGVAHNANDTFSMYFAEDTEVVLEATASAYIYQIIINPDEDAPETPTLNEIKVSGMNVNYSVGDEISLEGVVVKAYYSDYSVKVIENYTVNSDAVVNTAAGKYDVVFSYEGKSVTVKVEFEGPSEDPAIVKDTLLDFSTADALAAVQNNPKVTIDASVRFNSAEIEIKGTISFQVKAGTIINVIPYSNSQYVSYTIGAEGDTDLAIYNVAGSYTALEDCVIIYTGLDNNYLVGIEILCPIEEGKYVFGGSTVEGDVTGILASVPGISISGTCKTHSGGAQIGSDTLIFFTVPANGSVTIKGFDTSYGQLEVWAGDELIAMDSNACYVFSVSEATLVKIYAVNVGTAEAPAWNKSYITYIEVKVAEPETPEEPEITEWVLDATADLEALAKGDKDDGDTQAAGTNGFFTIHYSANTKIDGSNKSFEDGYSASQRLNFGGKTVIGSTIKNALEFTTNGPVTVTVWWVKNGDAERPVEILDASGASIAQTTDNPASGTLTITTFSITEAGTYYLGGLTNNNYYFKVAVKVAE
ncbi:MAG: bacterial Ig-like domain-containing protein [Clostridia bacterium]|nr:bacterial Ig-like domain-containing protein [Clostridia bacterium]